MDEANQDQSPLRGVKKRGRPPRVLTEAQVERGLGEIDAEDARQKAQAYALRIWQGQSPDLPRHERAAHVAAGVQAQGLSMDGVILPPTRDS